MNIKRIIISGLTIWIFGSLYGWLTCGWIFSWIYQIPPLIWLPPEQMMAPTNMLLSNVIMIISSILFSFAFALFYKAIPGNKIKKGIIFGLVIWSVGAFAGVGTMPFYMTIAATVVIYWLVQSIITSVINGIIVSLIYKEK